MPRNNPYDREMSPAHKVISNIGLGFIIVFLVAFIIWAIVSQPKNVRTQFDTIEITADFSDSDEQNEFVRLETELAETKGFSPAFIELFPDATALLKMEDSVYAENTPFVKCSGNCISVAMSYNNTNVKNQVSMDVLLIPFKKTDSGAIFGTPVRYTVNYDTATGVIEKPDLRTDNFRLSFYKLAVICNSGSSLNYDISLSSVISDKEAEDAGLLSGISTEPNSDTPVLTRFDSSSSVTGKIPGNGEKTLTVQFGDMMYDYFEALNISSEGGADSFRIILN